MSENVYTHGGDTGDLIYSMPCIRATGGGHLVLWPRNYVREPFTTEKVQKVATFFASQPYIRSVRFKIHEAPTHNLDDFRAVWLHLRRQGANGSYNLAELHLLAQNLPLKHTAEKWVDLGEVYAGRKHCDPEVVFARSFRYRNNAFPWKAVYEKYKNVAVFLGSADEWHEFTGNVGEVPHISTPTLLDAAWIISTAKLVIANQSALFALAVAMGIPRVLECWLPDMNCIFPGQINGVDASVEEMLPDL